MADDDIGLLPGSLGKNTCLFNADPVRPPWVLPAQHFCQFGVDCNLGGLGHGDRPLDVFRRHHIGITGDLPIQGISQLHVEIHVLKYTLTSIGL